MTLIVALVVLVIALYGAYRIGHFVGEVEAHEGWIRALGKDGEK